MADMVMGADTAGLRMAVAMAMDMESDAAVMATRRVAPTQVVLAAVMVAVAPWSAEAFAAAEAAGAEAAAGAKRP